MKASKFAVTLTSAVLFASGLAHAESAFQDQANQNQFVSKRPYHQPVVDRSNQNDGQWEGATLVKQGDAGNEPGLSQQKTLRVNALSKRPY